MKVWVDGRLLDPDEVHISAFDHGVTVGDGVFETAKVVDGIPFALTRHLRRLARSATGLGLPAPDEALVRKGIDEIMTAEPSAGRLRITYTGGVGPLGSDRHDTPSTLVIAVGPAGAWDATTDVATVPWTRNERSAVAGLKTTSYADNVVALSYAHDRGASEAIFANTRGELCEGTGSNVFLVQAGRLITPPLSSGCLGGITRELVVEWLAVGQVDLPLSALADSDEAFLTSSTRDIQPIRAVDGRVLKAAPGPVTADAIAEFARRSGADLDP